jgi:hypothetical protein
MKEKRLESLLEGCKAGPISKYNSDVIIMFDKNVNKESLLRRFRRHKILARELSPDKYLLSPSDGESNDILRHYVWEYYQNK